MKRNILLVTIAFLAMCMSGCSSKATDDQVVQMCKNGAEVKGFLQGASVEEAAARVEEEWAFKKKKNEEDLARDLKGWDDVLAKKLADLENPPPPPPEPAPEEESEEEDTEEKEAEEEEEEKTPEEIAQEKEERKKEILAEAQKAKDEIKKGYAPDFEKHESRKQRALKEAKESAERRLKKANKAIEKCIAKYKKMELSQDLATCRIQAKTQKDWNLCK